MTDTEKKMKKRFNIFLGILLIIGLSIFVLKLLIWSNIMPTTNLFFASIPDTLTVPLLIIAIYLEKLIHELNLSKKYNIIFSIVFIFAMIIFFLP